ncbi:MAG: hypothetical protein Kow00121_32830 [Elainellaceae cyanobacterium]
MTQVEQNSLNQRELRKLILSIRANANRLDLFLAICDDRNLQEALIQHYEAELSQQGFATYRTRLAVKQPSLKAALEQLTERELELRSAEKAVVTVLGGSELLGVRLTEERSEQERFFFSLQWTRESLREFQFPVVVWLSSTIATGLAQQAQDFWSWRSGVFEFESESRTLTPDLTLEQGLLSQAETETHSTNSIADLNQQITALEQQNPRSPLLVRLYNDLGNAYRQSYAHEPALQAYEQALNLAQALKDQAGHAKSFLNLGRTLYNCGRWVQAIDFYEQALKIYKTLGDRQGEAASLGNLGNAYRSLGQYQQAIDFQQQSLAIAREIGNRGGEAISLGNLGTAYRSLGQYQQAIDFYQQSLAIKREIGNRWGEGASLFNIGNALAGLDQRDEALQHYQQALAIYESLKLDHMVEKCQTAIAKLN